MLEIDKMLTLSTAHISPETRKWLDSESKTDSSCLTVYKKRGFGWFIYLPECKSDTNELPDDLLKCCELAADTECLVLCFDSDAIPLPYLPEYGD